MGECGPHFGVALEVSKDRKQVSANVGHGILSHFLSDEAKTISENSERSKHTWTFQLGPFAEHSIEIVKRNKKIFALFVDGEPFVEASAADIGCRDGVWECNFRFIGERAIDFEVPESNLDGVQLDSLGHVLNMKKHTHHCSVLVADAADLTRATLTIDDDDFSEIPVKRETVEGEAHLVMDAQIFEKQYGLSVPNKINREAPTGLMSGLRALAGNDDAAKGVGLAVVRAAALDATLTSGAAVAGAASAAATVASAAAAEHGPGVVAAAKQSHANAVSWLRTCCVSPNLGEHDLVIDTKGA